MSEIENLKAQLTAKNVEMTAMRDDYEGQIH